LPNNLPSGSVPPDAGPFIRSNLDDNPSLKRRSNLGLCMSQLGIKREDEIAMIAMPAVNGNGINRAGSDAGLSNLFDIEPVRASALRDIAQAMRAINGLD
jgi:hypothetical protein